MTRFEDRHRELRAAAEQVGAAYRAGNGVTGDVLMAVSMKEHFDDITGPLVDDLVAELRRWFDIRQHRVDAVGDERMRNELLGQKMEAERRMYAKLAALDEASGG